MNRNATYTKYYWLVLLLIPCIVFFSFKPATFQTGTLRVHFINTANGKNIVLRDSLYKNPFGEEYSVSKLKYYISHFSIPGANQVIEEDPYHLINAAEENNSFDVLIEPGTYHKVAFLLGVDSARNCSGAQTGALDPMNDMFWTWNSGYVMFKLEGTSPAAKSDLQRIEHHIGGYKGENNVATNITLDVPSIEIKEGIITEITIETNLDHYWKDQSEIKISEIPLCMTTGLLAKKFAANFPAMFSVKAIK